MGWTCRCGVPCLLKLARLYLDRRPPPPVPFPPVVQHVSEHSEVIDPVRAVVPERIAVLKNVNVPNSVQVVSDFHVPGEAPPRAERFGFTGALPWRFVVE